MIQGSSKSSIARLGHLSAFLLTTAFSIGLIGATKPQSAKPVAPVVTSEAQVQQQDEAAATATDSPATASTSADTELLHDATPAAEPTAELASAHFGPKAKHVHTIWLQVTAYCPCKKCCGPGAKGLTASGRSIRYNGGQFVAADTRVLKFGTKLVIPGYANETPVPVIDRGGAIKGYHIDLFFPTHEQAKQWGVKWMQVQVVD